MITSYDVRMDNELYNGPSDGNEYNSVMIFSLQFFTPHKYINRTAHNEITYTIFISEISCSKQYVKQPINSSSWLPAPNIKFLQNQELK